MASGVLGLIFKSRSPFVDELALFDGQGDDFPADLRADVHLQDGVKFFRWR